MMYCKATKQYIRVLDTPGFKDSEGVEKDDRICKQIEQCFKTQIQSLDYICICIPAPNARLTGDQTYVFGRLMGIFGKDLEKRIMFMITFCDGGAPQCLAPLKEAKMPVNRYFKFNNSALM